MAAKVVPGLDDNTRLSILDELRPEKQQEGDVTIAEAVEDWGTSEYFVREILDEAIERKEIKQVEGICSTGRKGIFFRRVVKLDETI